MSLYPTDENATYLASGDFDADGDEDLAASHFFTSASTVTILRNDGTGTYQFGQAVVGGDTLEDVVAGDLDADGDIDLAVTRVSGNVLLLRNNAGAFSPWVTFGLGPVGTFRSLAAADFDGDCAVDLAAAGYNTAGTDLAVLRNVNGDFTAPAISSYSLAGDALDVAAADMDSDGDIDLVVANLTTVSVHLNNGLGSLAPTQYYPTGANVCCPQSVALGDLDNDLDIDVAVSWGSSISVLLNNGNGSLGPPTLVAPASAYPRHLELADFDGDGDLDLAVGSGYSLKKEVQVLTNDGAAHFTPALTLPVGSVQGEVIAANLDGDGALDIAVALIESDGVGVLLNQTHQDCNNNGIADQNEPATSMAFVVSGTSSATPCSWGMSGPGFSVQGTFCVDAGAVDAAFAAAIVESINGSGCPGLRASRVNGLFNGFTVTAPGSTLNFCIGNPPGFPTCCFPGAGACNCNPGIEEFFFSGADCNDNLTDDAIDIASGGSLDANGNGVPDECEACSAAADCGDADGNGVRDDNCVWSNCSAGVCQSIGISYADAGGAFGACPPDGFCNIHDRGHVLTCFAGTNPCSSSNIDVGGPFGACPPDGFCNIHDATHALRCFAGTNPCTCPPGPAPQSEARRADHTTLSVAADSAVTTPGGEVQVRVYMDSPLKDFQGYQLHLGSSGGHRGALELIDIAIEPVKAHVFAARSNTFEAFNVSRGQMLSSLNAGGPATRSANHPTPFRKCS